MQIALKTGGNIKFDLKSYHEKLNLALCGISNKRTISNFKFLAENYFGSRKGMPEMSACTLMVPGYTNHEEVELIAEFILYQFERRHTDILTTQPYILNCTNREIVPLNTETGDAELNERRTLRETAPLLTTVCQLAADQQT